jgi:hypothetical protein
VVAAAAISTLAFTVTAHASGVTFPTPTKLQNGGGGEPMVVADTVGNVVVSAPQGVGGGEGDYWVSHDSGVSYPTSPLLLGGPSGGGDEDEAFAPQDGTSFAGRLYIADLAATYSTVCTSTDHGNTFNAVGPAPDPNHCMATPLGQVGPSSDRQWLTTDKNGRAYLTYHEFNSAQPLAFTTTNGGADGFSTACGSIIGTNDPLIEQYVPQDITGGTLVSKPVVDSAGNLYVLFTTTTQQENAAAVAAGHPTGTFSEVFMAVSTDHCATFNDYTVYDGYNSNLPCNLVPTCNAVQFGDIFNDLEIDSAGNLYSIAAGFVGTTAFAPTTDIYLFTSPASSHGQTWSGPIKLTNDGQGHMMPAATTGISPGQLAVGYFETVNGITDPNNTSAQWAYSVIETNDALAASPIFSGAQMTGGSGPNGNIYHTGAICNLGIICNPLSASGDRSLADFTSATDEVVPLANGPPSLNPSLEGCPIFSWAGNPNGDNNGTFNYVAMQSAGCFLASNPVGIPETPWPVLLVPVAALLGGAAFRVRRRQQLDTHPESSNTFHEPGAHKEGPSQW